MDDGACWWWLILCLVGTIAADLQIDPVEDAQLSVPELIVKYGYEVQGHTVITEDGYVLKVFRILPKRESIAKKLPVLLVHGLLGSSADYVVSGPNNSLAYLLADKGYDVWLANSRGSRYSKEHTRLSVESREYWDFSWHEMGYYDLPAMIDHVLNGTNSEKLLYIGHSQGTTAYFVLTSSRPEYNAKIALMTALSPAVGVQRIRSPILRFMQRNYRKIKCILDKLKIHQFLPYNPEHFSIVRPFCHPEKRNNLCVQLLELIAGPNPKIDPRLVLLYQGHFPQGTSVKVMEHHAQNVDKPFRQFDYGSKGNLQKYGSRDPPVYNLTASTAPVLIVYAMNDWVVHPKDVQKLFKLLPRVIATIPVADQKFNHLDFLLAKNARKEVHEKFFPVLGRFNRMSV